MEDLEMLKDICFQKICDNFDVVYKKVHISEVEREDAEALLFTAEWNYIPQLLSREFSEKLFHFLVKNLKLNDSTISVFHPKWTELKKVYITDCDHLTSKGFSILGHHKIESIAYKGIISFDNIINALDKEATKTIKSFTFTENATSENSDYESIIKLINLKELNLFETKFSSVNLQTLSMHVGTINSLNLSNISITQMQPLLNFKEHLTSLTVDLRQLNSSKQIIDVFNQLNKLTYLDISFYPESNKRFQNPNKKVINKMLDQTTLLPNLEHLDLSGIKQMVNLIPFVLSHKKLQFLGLVNTHWCSNDMFSKPEHENYRPDLQVAGDATQRQLVTSLRMYPPKCNMLVPHMDRLKRSYIWKNDPSLHPLLEVLEVVLSSKIDHVDMNVAEFEPKRALENHPNHREITNTCIDFISFIIVDKKIAPISTGILLRVVDAAMNAVEIFNDCVITARNSLYIMYSEQILELKKIRFSSILFASLSSYYMTLDIENVEIEFIMDYGFKIRQTIPDCESKLIKYMLEQLNRRDDSFENRRKSMVLLFIATHFHGLFRPFFKLGGIQIFISLLDFVIHKYLLVNEYNLFILAFISVLVQTAQDAELRSCMVVQALILKLKLLLESTIGDRFIAVVVLAFLTDVNETIWNDETFPNRPEISRTNILELLRKTTTTWEEPISSFFLSHLKPFNPLLLMTNETNSQLTYLAVWSMYQNSKIKIASTTPRPIANTANSRTDRPTSRTNRAISKTNRPIFRTTKATFSQEWLNALKRIPDNLIEDDPEIGRLRALIFEYLESEMLVLI